MNNNRPLTYDLKPSTFPNTLQLPSTFIIFQFTLYGIYQKKNVIGYEQRKYGSWRRTRVRGYMHIYIFIYTHHLDNSAFQPRQQKMQEDYGQSSATDFDQMHQRPQRAVVGDPMQQAPIHQEPPSKGDLMTQQTSGVDNETARKTAMHTNNPFVVRENQQAATVRSGMPSLPAAGVFDLDAAGNSSIITGYDNDPRSFNMRTAKQVAANHDKKSSISAHQQKQTYPTTTTTTTTSKQAVPPGRKSSSSAWTSSSVTGGAAVAAAAAATATGGGIMAKCVDYLRGSQQQASQGKCFSFFHPE